MNNVETMTLKQAMEDISRMIEHKDCTIHEQQATIEFLKDDAKHVYNHGVDDGFAKGVNAGMEKAWSLAQRIVHLDWDGDDNIHTVEDWFNLFTAKDAMEVMEMLDGKKPYWKEDIVRNVYECSKCGFASLIRHKFCPDCGVKME